MDKLIPFLKVFDPGFIEADDIVKARISSLGGGGYVTILAVTGKDNVFHIHWQIAKDTRILARVSQIGDNHSEYNYTRYKVATLCGKEIQDFHMMNSTSSCVEVALTKDNWVYTWVDTAEPLMTGINPMIWVGKEVMEVNIFISKHIFSSALLTHVAAGGRHALALDTEGRVYASGYHNRSPQNEPFEPDSDFEEVKGFPKKIVGIACGLSNSFAVTEDGEVYTWGCKDRGMIGDGQSSDKWQRTPVMISIKDAKIAKLACGEFFVLALTDDGKIYSWGLDLQREGNQPHQLLTKPKKLKGISAPVVDIYAGRNSGFFATKTSVYAWGKEYYPLPTILPFATIQEALMSSMGRVDFAVTLTKEANDKGSSCTFNGLFNDESYADIAFTLDGGSLKAHSAVLGVRSSVFREKFDSKWEAGKTINFVVKLDHSYKAFAAFLQFVYTGKWKIDTAVLQDVLKISDTYGDDKLKEEFGRHLLAQINKENVFLLYSHYHQRKLEGNKQESIFLYAWKHWDELKGTPELASLEEGSLKELNRRIKWRKKAAEQKRAQVINEGEAIDSEQLRMAILQQMYRVMPF